MIKIPSKSQTDLINYLNKVGYFDDKDIDVVMAELILIAKFEEFDGWNKSAHQLAEKIGKTTKYWNLFLNNNYIEVWAGKQLREFASIQQRVSIASLAQLASTGDKDANKRLAEYTGLINKDKTQTVVVMHHVTRPEIESYIEEVEIEENLEGILNESEGNE